MSEDQLDKNEVIEDKKVEITEEIDTAESGQSKQQKIDEIMKYKQESTLLIGNLKQLQHLNDKLQNDLIYIQDYISKLINQ
ncbi:hypothetical protein KGF54_005251 [Candida jiufengensis]|uniref:uncharacterized protein n=1 Tax=Candida jiufengensis TaxID=497108 RepID=UPI002225615F|nr:uncharacterized protein KGF54_005251 [Candida jiufengensis]KAI5950103.1 hypothetical protein KGF54_005251 [Candida jiufengensis]